MELAPLERRCLIRTYLTGSRATGAAYVTRFTVGRPCGASAAGTVTRLYTGWLSAAYGGGGFPGPAPCELVVARPAPPRARGPPARPAGREGGRAMAGAQPEPEMKRARAPRRQGKA